MAIAKEIMVRISSNLGSACPICKDVQLDGMEQFEEACNHLLSHGLKCLHVGQETIDSSEGNPWQTTVAVFGK